MIKRGFLAVLCSVAMLSVAVQAHAQCGGFYGGGYNFWDSGRLYGVLSQNVPYYSAFPPVYYSAPVARTYGYSPFAYPPGTMTPEIEVNATAAEIVNPYFEPASTSAAEGNSSSEADDRVTQSFGTSQPLAIANPFVQAPSLEHESDALLAALKSR